MNIENSGSSIPKNSELDFEVKQHKEGIVLYVFKDLAVAIDTTGKNYKELPELYFGPYDNELNNGSLHQPEKTERKIDMKYVSECIEKVALASGIHAFWFYPFGGDASEGNKERREEARMRLFKRIFPTIQLAPGGYGYILTI